MPLEATPRMGVSWALLTWVWADGSGKWGFPSFSHPCLPAPIAEFSEAHEFRSGPGKAAGSLFPNLSILWLRELKPRESRDACRPHARLNNRPELGIHFSDSSSLTLYFPTLPLGLIVVVLQLLSHVQLFVCSAPGLPVLHYLLEFALGLGGSGKKNILLRPSSWMALSWARHHFFPVLVSLS